MTENSGKIISHVSAGGVIFKRLGLDVRYALMRDRFGRWTFPKGHVEPGESPERAAVREVAEEVELAECTIVASLGETSHSFSIPEGTCRKQVFWFLLTAPARAELAVKPAEGARDAGWFSAPDALKMLGYQNLKRLLRKADRLLLAQTKKGGK